MNMGHGIAPVYVGNEANVGRARGPRTRCIVDSRVSGVLRPREATNGLWMRATNQAPPLATGPACGQSVLARQRAFHSREVVAVAPGLVFLDQHDQFVETAAARRIGVG